MRSFEASRPSICHVKRPVTSIGHFKATPQSALVHLTKNNCLPAESNKQRSRRQVVSIFQYYCSANGLAMLTYEK